jgi:uncharacterized membrane protein YdjX (TVP38/TMEM64 family)
MKLSKRLKTPRFWLAIAFLVLLLLCCLTPFREWFNEQFLVQQLREWGHWAVCLFVLVYTLATVLGFPGTVITMAGSVVFGLVWGTFWSVVGATLGAIGAFWMARYLLHNWAQRRFGHHKALKRFNQAVMDKPLAFVLTVRFAPISPFNVVNFLFGLTPIGVVDYAIGTFLGITPGTLAYAWLGVTGREALRGGDRIPFVLALVLLTLLTALPLWATKKSK